MRATVSTLALLFGATTGAVLLTSAASGAAPTSSDVPASPHKVAIQGPRLSPQDQAIMDAQAPYMARNDEVPRLLGDEMANLAGTQIDLPDKKFLIYLASDVPASIDILRAQGMKDGISVVVARAQHSRSELMTVSEQIFKLPGVPNGYSIIIATDGSGLTFQVPNPHGISPTTQEALAALQAEAGVPIDVQSGTQLQLLLYTPRPRDAGAHSAHR